MAKGHKGEGVRSGEVVEILVSAATFSWNFQAEMQGFNDVFTAKNYLWLETGTAGRPNRSPEGREGVEDEKRTGGLKKQWDQTPQPTPA